MTDKLKSRKEGHVGYVTFNNPERLNAVSLDMWKAMGDTLGAYADDDDVRVVVLSGAGGKAFVSGADISRFRDERSNEEAIARYNDIVEVASTALAEFPKPTIAMIRGYCIGGGVAISLCCDLRIATDNSRFGVPAAKLGLGYGYTGIKRLIDTVGPAFAKEIFYTARQFSAAEAHQMGLVNRLLPDGELEAYVKGYTDRIAENAPLTIRTAKFTIGQALKDPAERNLAAVSEMVATCFASKDYIEGREAFMEKRKPVFTGT